MGFAEDIPGTMLDLKRGRPPSWAPALLLCTEQTAPGRERAN